MAVGFIGLGHMGKGMARNLQRHGSLHWVYDVDPMAMGEFTERGAQCARAPRELASLVDVVVLSVPGKVAEAVVLGPDGLLAGARPGLTVIDTSSTGPIITRRLEEAARTQGVAFLDAPVSGGPPKAAEGSLAIMVGGDRGAFDRALPILHRLGRPAYVGASCSGQIAKLLNNMIVGVNFAIVCEAFALARRSGIGQQEIYEAIRGGAAGSWVMETAGLALIQNDFRPGGTVDLHTRDLANALQYAGELEFPVPVTGLVYQLYLASQAMGDGGKAQQALIRLWEAIGGSKPDERSR